MAPLDRMGVTGSSSMQFVVASTTDIAPKRLAEIRRLMDDAFGGDFSDADWGHTVGGVHVLPSEGPVVVHAALVPRTLEIGRCAFQAGYVEGVATTPVRQRGGLGSAVMAVVNGLVRDEFELGVLSTSSHEFYERLGWVRWRGPTYVRNAAALTRTTDEDSGIMVFRHGSTRALDLTQPIVCEARDGDDW